ncbi:MAG: DUF2079 domain-containing protein [Patescibacteria group bacterium]
MFLRKLLKLSNKYIPFLAVFVYSVGIFFIALRINIFRYNNFDYGKFDLGNMTQMVWNTMNGRFMMLTDLFGTNLPRWSMSHVDPILVLFVPIFALFQSPLTLVISQLILVIFSSLLIYLIANIELKSKWAGAVLGISFLFYPAVGFIIAWTGFHGISAAIPFFLGSFYILEKMCKEENFSSRMLALFWILTIIAMSGKEEVSLFYFVLGLFVWFIRKKKKFGLLLSGLGIFWFCMTFFVIIPHYAQQRIDGYNEFAKSLDLVDANTTDVVNDNFFLSRYEAFGSSYSEIAVNMVKSPDEVVRVIFSGDKSENFSMTFAPMLFLPFLYLPLFAVALPELFINYSTTAGGIGTSEIYNHRISLIIPVLFIAAIYAIGLLSRVFGKNQVRRKIIILALSLGVLVGNVQTSFAYENPIYLWLTQAVQKRVPALFGSLVFAKSDEILAKETLNIGDIVKLSPVEVKDRECALQIVNSIPEDASVSGPDYLGAHLSMRETYAIFPALYKEADYVIVDVFAEKISRILEVDKSLVRNVVSDMITSGRYKLTAACGNLYVFEHKKTEVLELLPLQDDFDYTEEVNFEMLNTLAVVDYSIPEEIIREEPTHAQFVYIKRGSDSLDGYVFFTTFVNEDTGDLYQFANIPSYSLEQPADWEEERYYVEDVDLVLPKYLKPGTYKVFVGMSNRIRTRSVYLGNTELR